MTLLSEVEQGDVLIVDEQYSRILKGQKFVVHRSEFGLYIRYNNLLQYLSGQTDDNVLVGLTKDT